MPIQNSATHGVYKFNRCGLSERTILIGPADSGMELGSLWMEFETTGQHLCQ